jgi:hypothetical protein
MSNSADIRPDFNSLMRDWEEAFCNSPDAAFLDCLPLPLNPDRDAPNVEPERLLPNKFF